MAQPWQPMHRPPSTRTTGGSPLRCSAVVGQASTHGASSQCMQASET